MVREIVLDGEPNVAVQRLECTTPPRGPSFLRKRHRARSVQCRRHLRRLHRRRLQHARAERRGCLFRAIFCANAGEVIHGHQEVHPFGRGTFVRRRSRCRALIDRRAIPRRFVTSTTAAAEDPTLAVFSSASSPSASASAAASAAASAFAFASRDRRLLPLLLTEFTFEFFPGARFLLGRRRRRRRSRLGR